MIDTLENILKQAYEDKSNVQIPFTIKNNKIVELDRFYLLSNLSDSNAIKVVEKTKKRLVLEIDYLGVKQILNNLGL